MAIAISEPVAELSDGTDGTSFALGAFTPTSNSLLVCIVFATGTNATGSMSGGGLTWNLEDSATYNGSASKAYLFTALAGSSPGSTTPTFDCSGDSATGCDMMIWQVTGYDTVDATRQFKFATSGASDTVTWSPDSALLTGNAYIAAVTMVGDRNGWDPGPAPGGWTVTAAAGHNGPSVDSSGAYRINGLTSSSLSWQTSDLVDCAGYLVEIAASSGATTHTVSITDNLAETDSTSRQADGNRTFSDSIAQTDTFDRLASAFRTLEESLGVSDTAMVFIFTQIMLEVIETWGVADTTATQGTWKRDTTDSIAQDEAFDRLASANRTIEDNFAIADAAQAFLNVIASLVVSDSLGVSDSAAYQTNVARAVSDDIAYVDSTITVVTYLRALSDAIGILDSSGIGTIFALACAECIGVTDGGVERILFLSRQINEALGVVDSPAIATIFNRLYTESIAIDPLPTHSMTFARAIGESVGVSDLAERTATSQRQVTDSITYTQAFATASNWLRTISDNLGAADTLRLITLVARAITDSIGITDVVGLATRLKIAASESFGISDSVVPSALRQRAITEAFGIVESVVRNADANRTLSDSLGQSDTAQRAITNVRVFLDSIGLSDALASKTNVARGVSDSIGGSDAAIRNVTFSRAPTDTIGVDDDLSQAVQVFREVADSIGISTDIQTALLEAAAAIWEAIGIETWTARDDDMGATAVEIPEKQPGETRTYAFEFSEKLSSVETLSSGAAVVAAPAGLTISGVSISGTRVECTVAGGVDGVRYKLQATAVSSLSQTVQCDGYLSVKGQ